MDPEKCIAVGAGVEVGETGKANVFDVQLVLINSRPCTTPLQPTVDLKPKPTRPVIAINRSPAVYEVSYQPSTHGRHELNVQVNGTPIQGSPFQVYVRQSPHLLDQPVKLVKLPINPYCIAIAGEKMVVGEGNSLSLYSMKDQQLQAVSTLSQYIEATGVAIDERGNTYMADINSDRVLKFSSNLKVVKSVGGRGVKQGQFFRPHGVALSKDGTRLFVCDSKNHRIQVLNTDLRVLGCFGRHGSGQGELNHPVDVSCDSVCRVYIADIWNSRVQVFSHVGCFLRTISHRGSGPGEVDCPRGIHVDHDWVYVTEEGNRRVSVFTVSGKFIASFGGQHLNSPQGITTDEDGYVYVCDFQGSINRY